MEPSVFGDEGNPNPDNIRRVGKSFGIDDIFESIRIDFEAKWIRPIHQGFIAQDLQAIVLRRHGIAHTGTAANLPRTDLAEAVRFPRLLGVTMERMLRGHVRALKAAAR
jgi:hypothetical protein